MKPIEQAMDWCDRNEDSFEAELLNHLDFGWVYSGDDAFVMATEECSALLLRPDLNKGVDNDTWYVYLYAGSLKRVLELIPFNKKYIAFRRNNGPLKLYDAEKLLARIGRM
jgi:hypothetical protein